MHRLTLTLSYSCVYKVPMIAVRVAESAAHRMAAVHRCADVLVEIDSVFPAYREAMVAQELAMSTYLGAGVAAPHGLAVSSPLVRRDAVAVLLFPDGVDWAGRAVHACVAIAAGSEARHVETLTSLAEILLDPARAAVLRRARFPEQIVRVFCG